MEKEHSMIKEFEIRGFKKFDQIKFEDLGRINLFLGNNNTGKTSILEAVYAYTRGESVSAIISECFFRNKKSNNKYDFLEKIISYVNDQNELPFKFLFFGKYENGEIRKFEHEFSPFSILADIKPNLMNSFGSQEVGDKDIIDGKIGELSIKFNLSDKIYELMKGNLNDLKMVEKFEEEIERILGNIGGAGDIDYKFAYESFMLGFLKSFFDRIGNWSVHGSEGKLFSQTINYPFEKVQKKPFEKCRFIDILSHRNQDENTKIFSFIQRGNLLKEFIQELSEVFNGIEDIEAVLYPDGTVGFVGLKLKDKGLLPLYNFGDGMQRWFNLLGGMIVYQNAIHCIEEIDATMHPVAQKNVGANLVKYAQKYNNQIFMTSHSLEFVDHLLEGVYGSDEEVDEDMIRVYTLKEDSTGKTKVRKLTGKEAYKSREKFKLELREDEYDDLM